MKASTQLSGHPDSNSPDKNIDLLELSIKGNDFEFNGEMYQQVCGCAMSKHFSPNFASIYVAEWKEATLSKSIKSHLLYLRYLDNILIIWPHSKENCRTSLRYQTNMMTIYNLRLQFQTNQLIFCM